MHYISWPLRFLVIRLLRRLASSGSRPSTLPRSRPIYGVVQLSATRLVKPFLAPIDVGLVELVAGQSTYNANEAVRRLSLERRPTTSDPHSP